MESAEQINVMAVADDARQPTSGAGDSVNTGSDVLLPIARTRSSASDVAIWIDTYRDDLPIYSAPLASPRFVMRHQSG